MNLELKRMSTLKYELDRGQVHFIRPENGLIAVGTKILRIHRSLTLNEVIEKENFPTRLADFRDSGTKGPADWVVYSNLDGRTEVTRTDYYAEKVVQVSDLLREETTKYFNSKVAD